jgi:hypothetical protein
VALIKGYVKPVPVYSTPVTLYLLLQRSVGHWVVSTGGIHATGKYISTPECTENPNAWRLLQEVRDSEKPVLLPLPNWGSLPQTVKQRSLDGGALESVMTAASCKGQRISAKGTVLCHHVFQIKKPGHVLWQKMYSNLWLIFMERQRRKHLQYEQFWKTHLEKNT